MTSERPDDASPSGVPSIEPLAVRPVPARSARRDLPLLLAGSAVSTIGASLSLLAVMIQLRPAGAVWVAALLAAELVPVVALAPLAGRLVDRVRNRELIVGSILVQAVGVLLAAAVGLGEGRAWVIVAGMVLVGVGTAVVNPAVSALLPKVSGEAGATRAYGWYSAITQAGFLVGFAVAGVLVEATSVRVALVADGVTYVLMALAVTAVRAQRVPEPHLSQGAVWLGFARVRDDRLLLVGVVGLAAAVLATVVVNVADVFFVLEDIGAGPAAYGLVTAVWPAAGVAGGWWAGKVVGERRLFAALAAGAVVMGLALLVAGAAVSLVAVGVGWMLGGAAASVQRVAITALVRERTEDAVRGRVFSAVNAVAQAGNLVGLAAGAVVVGLVGARSSLLLAGVMTVLAGVVTWLVGRGSLET